MTTKDWKHFFTQQQEDYLDSIQMSQGHFLELQKFNNGTSKRKINSKISKKRAEA